jgi:polyisoprenoid-binding protein YceI
MSRIHLHRVALVIGATAVVSLGGAHPIAQSAAGATGLEKIRISIAGTSNVHDYTASTTTARLVRLQLATGALPTLEALAAPGTVEAFEIAIPAATLSSEKDGLDKNMHKALKVKEHQDITFRLGRLEPTADARTFRATGVLQIAGIERTAIFPVTVERTAAALVVRGEVPLLMTDFDIVPPKAMLGMLKTDPKVVITFEAVLSGPLT